MFNTLTRMGASNPSGYEIERSLRFRGVKGGSHPQLDRTIQSGGNAQKWTYAVWFKYTCLGSPAGNSAKHFLGPFRGGDGSNESTMQITSADQFRFYDSGATTMDLKTKRVFRDPAAWMHLVVAVDTTQGTASNRVKIYFNGIQETNWATETYPAEDYEMGWNKNQVHSIGRYAYPDASSGANTRFGGYMADLYFIDDQQLTPSSFGETNANTGQFVPIEYEGTYGTTGFYLDFSDNSSVAALGTDRSGNSNDWAPDNLSVAAGVDEGSVIDTPTNNYPIFNTLYNRKSYAAEITNAGLDCHLPNGSYYQFSTGTMAMKSGKWYWEVTVEDSGTAGDDTKCRIGIAEPYAPWNSQEPVYRWRTYMRDGQKIVGDQDSNTTSAYGASYTDGDVIGVALDLDAGTLVMYKNGTTQGTLDSTVTSAMGDNGWVPHVSGYASPNFNINFGQRTFAHTMPTGYQHLCTANLPTPTIKKGTNHFDIALYTGNGTATTITGLNFSPNLVQIKGRDVVTNHRLTDTTRGVGKSLKANTAEIEETGGNEYNVSHFTSDGWTTTSGAGDTNNSGSSFISWNWNESATAGFDIVGYTGTGSATTISHGLGVKPDVIIVKNRDVADGWQMYHQSMGATHTSQMDGAGIFEDTDAVWNDTEPTSSVFSVKDDDKSNASGEDYIAYLWSSVEGYSKFGSYEGNGSTDGPFIHLGFRPAYLLLKRVETTPNAYWNIFDSTRDPYNSAVTADFKRLLWHEAGAEATNHANYTPPDLLSNGFKLRHGGADKNYDDKKFIYMAFAERPFKYSNAR